MFEAIENVPTHFYHKVMLGLPGRDEQIENYCHTIRAVGRAGVPILGYHFMPNSVWRTEKLAPTRGGAGATQFDQAVVDAIRQGDVIQSAVVEGDASALLASQADRISQWNAILNG